MESRRSSGPFATRIRRAAPPAAAPPAPRDNDLPIGGAQQPGLGVGRRFSSGGRRAVNEVGRGDCDSRLKKGAPPCARVTARNPAPTVRRKSCQHTRALDDPDLVDAAREPSSTARAPGLAMGLRASATRAVGDARLAERTISDLKGRCCSLEGARRRARDPADGVLLARDSPLATRRFDGQPPVAPRLAGHRMSRSSPQLAFPCWSPGKRSEHRRRQPGRSDADAGSCSPTPPRELSDEARNRLECCASNRLPPHRGLPSRQRRAHRSVRQSHGLRGCDAGAPRAPKWAPAHGVLFGRETAPDEAEQLRATAGDPGSEP
jgi:hypothetical protein